MLKNILANIVGRFWSVLSNYLFIPIYINILGLESYAVISFSLVLLGIISILDSGLTSTLSKEFASKQKTADDRLKLLSTLEFFYIILVIILILLFLIFSFELAGSWLKLNSLNANDVSVYLKILGIGLAFQLISNFYMGGLIGLEKQVVANKYQIIYGIIKNGVVLIIIFIKPSLLYFFIWQTVITVIYVFFIRYKLQSHILGKKHFSFNISFNRDIFSKVWAFATGMLLISIVASINTQLDKVLISKLLNIEELGVYNIAGSVAQALFVLVTPVSVAILPRFTAMYSSNEALEASILYHTVLKGLSILIFAVSANLIFNSSEIIWAWTGNLDIAEKAGVFMPYMIFGTALSVLMMIPFSIAIANSYTKLNNFIGILSICFTIPAYIFMINYFGSLGAAISWCAMQLLVAPIYLHLINKRFVKLKSTWRLLLSDMMMPILVTFSTAFVLAYVNFGASRLSKGFGIAFNTMLTLLIAAVCLIKKSHFIGLGDKIKNYINLKKSIR